jgi:hypothetical protein
LDVCVASPNAAAAAGDAAEAAFKRKLRRYWREIPQLLAAGIVFRPLVWPADGRPHPAVTRTLVFASEQATSRCEHNTSARQLRARWRHDIQVALQQRRAAMARSVLPRKSARDAWLLTGRAESVPSSDRREPPFDQGGTADDEEEAGGLDEGVELTCPQWASAPFSRGGTKVQERGRQRVRGGSGSRTGSGWAAYIPPPQDPVCQAAARQCERGQERARDVKLIVSL